MTPQPPIPLQIPHQYPVISQNREIPNLNTLNLLENGGNSLKNPGLNLKKALTKITNPLTVHSCSSSTSNSGPKKMRPVAFKSQNQSNTDSINNKNLGKKIRMDCKIVVMDGIKSEICPENFSQKLLDKAIKPVKKTNEHGNLKLAVSETRMKDIYSDKPSLVDDIKNAFATKSKELWNQLSDVGAEHQQELPDTEELFNRVRDQMNVLTQAKEHLADELHKTERLVRRVYNYMQENRDELQSNVPKMKNILKKFPNVNDVVMQSELAKKFFGLNEKQIELFKLYQKEKCWMEDVLTKFGTLFALAD